MRRKDREITDQSTIDQIIAESKFCRMALCDNGRPYIVPLCYGYKDKTLYAHSASEGHKIDILRNNNLVCIEFESGAQVVENPIACKWKLRYKSVIAWGMVAFIEDKEEKRRGLDIIMANYGPGRFEYSQDSSDKIVVYKIPFETMTCKISA
jgi:uncharacterized protein